MLNARFFFAMMSQIVIFNALTFLMPIMAVHLKEFGYHPSFIGFCFAIPTLAYVVASIFVFKLVTRYSKRQVIFIGFFMVAIAYFMIGPSAWIGLDKEGAMILIGLSILGMAGGFVVIPVMPEMIEAIEADHTLTYDMEEVNQNISGMFIAA
jgi:MFS family permease